MRHLLLSVALALTPFAASAQPAPASTPRGRAVVHIARVTKAPTIDGLLDDAAWTSAPIPTEEWLSYSPLNGGTIPQRTTVWVTYDDDNLYFAFKCDDPEPKQIKTSVARRDNAFSDDWVGLSLDSLGTGQLSYHMMINPSGVQMDLLNSIAGGEDTSPDWIWDSAGRLTDTGYTVEVRLPLQSIRFTGGSDFRMGIMFWRRVSRTGISVSWPALEPGKWVFESNASMIIPELKPRLTREVIPYTTFSSNQDRATPLRWDGARQHGDTGLSAKMGLAPTVTLDATVNPDFSQVESDAFQVQVNTRFPVFFSEKRPFFMEGAGMFTLAGAGQGDAALITAVNTRNIVNPDFGAKLTGSLGRMNVATLTAVDQEHLSPTVTVPLAGRGNRTFNIFRGQYSLKDASYAGVIYADVEQHGAFNRTGGLDLSYKLSPHQTVNMFALQSFTHTADDARARGGFGGQAAYSYDTRTWSFNARAEHYDTGFRMDTAFQNRVGDTQGLVHGEYSFYPGGGSAWVRRVRPYMQVQSTHDEIQRGNELVSQAGVMLFFTRQGTLMVQQQVGHQPFAGNEFDVRRWFTLAQAQVFRWLSVNANAGGGGDIFYDPAAPFAGRSLDVAGGLTFQPSGRFSQGVDVTHLVFDRTDTGAHVFTVNIVNTRTTYQFTRHFFLRNIIQYDSSQSRVLTDFLASYEPRPGTVLYAGYGSLIERRDYVNGAWMPGSGTYLTTTRGIFLKASYLWRF
jgi:hypothetical protein